MDIQRPIVSRQIRHILRGWFEDNHIKFETNF